jgi:hypothetical protein
MKQKMQFWSERVYARDSVTIPRKVQRTTGITKSWSIREIVAELLREPGNCTHVSAPRPPRVIYGLDAAGIGELELDLYERASRLTEPYVRRGREHRRAVRRTTPILLVAVASYPGPLDDETEERRHWQQLVVDAARERWGEKVASVIAHEDESHFHLHIVVHNDGASVKPLHFGHASAMGLVGPVEDMDAGEAYREGGRAAQDWFHARVGGPMGWERRSSAPRPRTNRAQAIALRELALDDREAELLERERRLRQTEAEQLEASARRPGLSAPLAGHDGEASADTSGHGLFGQAVREEPSTNVQDASADKPETARRTGLGFRSLRPV